MTLETIVLGFAAGVIGGAVYVHLTDWIIRRRIERRHSKERDG